ncbi:hypothetical protein N0Y54_26025 [Nostoc punctiforme UO1]
MFSLDALFCHVDDFCKAFEAQWHKKLLNHGGIKRVRAKSLCLSEIMTIIIAFHQNHYRNFKHFYLNQVKQQSRYVYTQNHNVQAAPALVAKEV